MVREDRGIMSVQELWRVAVMRQTMEKPLPQVKARALVGLTPRHSQASWSGRCQQAPMGVHLWDAVRPRTSGSRSRSRQRPFGSRCSGRGTSGRWWRGEVGRVAGDSGTRGDAAGLALGKGRDTLPTAEAPAPGVAGADGPCGGTGLAGWFAPCLVRGA